MGRIFLNGTQMGKIMLNGVEYNASSGGGETVKKLKCYSGKIANTTGEVSADSDYSYTDYFPIPNGSIIFNLGSSTNSSIGITLYKADKTYAEYFTFNSKFRTVNLSQYYEGGSVYGRVTFANSNRNYVAVIDVVNGVMYSPNTPVMMDAS